MFHSFFWIDAFKTNNNDIVYLYLALWQYIIEICILTPGCANCNRHFPTRAYVNRTHSFLTHSLHLTHRGRIEWWLCKTHSSSFYSNDFLWTASACENLFHFFSCLRTRCQDHQDTPGFSVCVYTLLPTCSCQLLFRSSVMREYLIVKHRLVLHSVILFGVCKFVNE